MKQTLNIRNYQHVSNFVADLLKSKQATNHRYSLRALARQLGYKNPSMLADVIAGRRSAGRLFLSRLASTLQLSERDRHFLHALSDNRQTQLNKPSTANLALDKFRYIADWYHLVLLEFIKLKEFKSDPAYVSNRLIPQLSRGSIAHAWDRLARLGLIKHDKNREWTRDDSAEKLFVGENVSSEAVRLHHRQMIELAGVALETRPVSERDISGSTVAIRLEDLPRIKAAIYQLHHLVNEASAPQGDADAVYRLNVQLFRFDKEDK